MVRTRTYDFYCEQKDSMDALPSIEGIESPNFRLDKTEVEFGDEEEVDGYLIQYYYATLPLMESLKDLCKKLKEREHLPDDYFKNNNFCDAGNRVKADIASRLMFNNDVIKYEEAILEAISITNLEGVGLQSIISYNHIGYAYNLKGMNDKAQEANFKGLEIAKKLFGDNHEYVASFYNNIGSLYNDMAKHDLALKFYHQALDVALLGKNPKATASTCHNIGSIYKDKGESDLALKFYQQALSIRGKIFKNNHPDIAISYGGIAAIYLRKGEYERALEFYQKSHLWLMHS
jgi:tetratricopeptide (TPR) repeat protein